jgi:hypothetical protein
MKKFWKLAIVLAAIAVIAIGTIGAGAWWTANQTSPDSNFSSGTLSLDGPGITQFDLGTVPAMAPGDKTGYVVIRIQNTGTTNLAWFGDLVVTDSAGLSHVVYIDDAKMEFLGGHWAEPTDHYIANGKGSGVYASYYDGIAAADPMHVVSLFSFDGNNGMGVTPYEFNGALRPGFAYQLTLRFGFAEEAGNEYQGLSGDSGLKLNFKVDATQVTTGALEALHPGFGVAVPWLQTQLANQLP